MIQTIWYKLCDRFFPNLINSNMKIKELRKKGVAIGKGTYFFNAGNITVDASRPELLTIGEYCKITGGTIILTHDYSRSVLRRLYGDIVPEAKRTKIGNNIFIGMNSIILMGTEIGDNSIVGAGSVCRGVYPPNSVIAGNPARVILSIDEFYQKRKQKSIEEAKELAIAHYERFGKKPSISDMGWFFPLYLERSHEEILKHNLCINLSGDDSNDVLEKFLASSPYFSSYDEFLKESFPITQKQEQVKSQDGK